MAGPTTDTYKIIYRDNLQLVVQEKTAQFDNAFEYTGQVKGKQVQVTDLVGKIEARIDAPDGGDTPDIHPNHEPVWMRPRRIDVGTLLRKEDDIKAATSYQSTYVRAHGAGIIRARNAILASALFGPRLIGNEVPVSTAWAGREVAITVGGAGPSVGMNVKKILQAIKYAEDDEISFEDEMAFLALDPQEVLDLYNDLTYISKDYRDRAQLDDKTKRVTAIFDIPIIPTKRIADKAANQSTAAFWFKSGMYWGEAMPLSTDVGERPDKQFRTQLYAETWLAATRLEDAKAIKIINVY